MDAWRMIVALLDMDEMAEQGGTLEIDGREVSDEYLKGYFGQFELRKGSFVPGRYVYQNDVNQSNLIKLEPDIVIYQTWQCNNINLWRIE